MSIACVCIQPLRRAQDTSAFLPCLFLSQQIIQDDTELPYKSHAHIQKVPETRCPLSTDLRNNAGIEEERRIKPTGTSRAQAHNTQRTVLMLTSSSFIAQGNDTEVSALSQIVLISIEK